MCVCEGGGGEGVELTIVHELTGLSLGSKLLVAHTMGSLSPQSAYGWYLMINNIVTIIHDMA